VGGTTLVSNAAKATREKTVRNTGRRLKGAIIHFLGVKIVSGAFMAGTVLTGEVAASAELDVSRTAYREAVQALIAKGLVESRPKIGTRVLARTRWNLLDPDVLAWAFAGEPDAGLIRNLFELRAIIEPAAAALAAQRRSPGDLARMKQALSDMSRHRLSTDAGRGADRDFHEAILRATGNEALVSLGPSIGAAVAWTTQVKMRGGDLPRNPLPDHKRVHKAIAAGDADAARSLMQILVSLALKDTGPFVKLTP
jgi:DNA-binding FadR family transcriptional regulator